MKIRIFRNTKIRNQQKNFEANIVIKYKEGCLPMLIIVTGVRCLELALQNDG